MFKLPRHMDSNSGFCPSGKLAQITSVFRDIDVAQYTCCHMTFHVSEAISGQLFRRIQLPRVTTRHGNRPGGHHEASTVVSVTRMSEPGIWRDAWP